MNVDKEIKYYKCEDCNIVLPSEVTEENRHQFRACPVCGQVMKEVQGDGEE